MSFSTGYLKNEINKYKLEPNCLVIFFVVFANCIAFISQKKKTVHHPFASDIMRMA